MRLRRFEAASVAEALAEARRTLGAEAVVLHARALPGSGDAPGAGRVEVTAAVDDQALGGEVPATERGDGAEAAEALEEIRGLLEDLRAERGRATGVVPGMRAVYRRLTAQEVPPALARRLLGRMVPDREAAGRGLDLAGLRAAAARRFQVAGPIDPGGRQRRVALVGPTGVGKTTTIAKLAGQLGLAGKARVALLTLDTYRIGAVAQIQIYADLLEVPLHVVRTAEEARLALAAVRDADLVLVDTMGRSPRGAEGIAAVGRVLGTIPDLEVHLVLSATTKGADLEEALRRFRPLGYRRLLATKLDEARSAAPLLGLAMERGLPISYVSAGQEVPDDLEPATPWRLAELLLPEPPAPRRRASPAGGWRARPPGAWRAPARV